MYMYGHTVVTNMHNIMLFRGPISLLLLLQPVVEFHMMRGQIVIFLTLAL